LENKTAKIINRKTRYQYLLKREQAQITAKSIEKTRIILENYKVSNTRETAQFTETLKQKPKVSEGTKKRENHYIQNKCSIYMPRSFTDTGARRTYRPEKTPKPDGKSRASWKSQGVKKPRLDYPRKKEI